MRLRWLEGRVRGSTRKDDPGEESWTDRWGLGLGGGEWVGEEGQENHYIRPSRLTFMHPRSIRP